MTMSLMSLITSFHGQTARLYRRLVEEEGIAESAQTANGMPGVRYPNLFMIFAVPRHPHTNAELEKSIYLEIEKLKKEPVSEKEMKKIKNQLKADLIRGLDSNYHLASALSYYETITGDFRYMTEHINVIEKIKPEDIMAAANKYLEFGKQNRSCP